jgi:hypothetical protein
MQTEEIWMATYFRWIAILKRKILPVNPEMAAVLPSVERR